MLLYENRIQTDYTVSKRYHYGCYPHLHHHVEAGIITRGETEVIVDGKSCLAKEGDVFIVFPNSVHFYVDSKDVEGYILIINPDELPHSFKIMREHDISCPVFHSPSFSTLLTLFERAETLSKGNEDYGTDAAKSYCETIISEILIQCGNLIHKEKSDFSATKKVLLYCDENYKEDISLDTLERELGYSRYYISHIFSDNVKISFPDYLRYLRISAAKNLLKHSEMNMADISAECGYNSIRTFNRQFLAETGQTPKEYYISKRKDKI